MATSTTIKYDTYNNWSTSNPVLSSGEVSIDTTNNKAKIGDGTTKWNDLSYSTTDIATAIISQTKNLTLDSGTELVTSSLSYNPMTNDLKVGTDGNGIVTARRFEGTAKDSDTANGVSVYDTDPVGTRVGQIYFNSNYGELRTCTNVANNTWESVRTITAKMWATSGTSPDVVVDDDSPTGYTQSSKAWALYSKTKAQESETSATNAKISETNAATSATNAEESNQYSNSWAVAVDSPDDTTDADSPTGKTQSARSWALLAKARVSLDNYIVTLLDGTKEKYEAVQKAWFIQNGAETADSTTLTSLMDRWYTITRKPWNGWTRFSNIDVLSVTKGEKMGDLKGTTLVPSTDTVAGQDDFAGNPLFAVTKVNWTMANSQPVITAIEGISPDFEIDNPDKLVGVVQMTGYHWYTTLAEPSQYYDEGYSATWLQTKSHIEPLPEAVRPDKTVRPWVIHAAYIAGVNNGKMTCCSGQVPKGNVSHNSSHDMAKANGADYSGTCSCDRSFLILMCRILLGSLTLDGILNGCYSYYLNHTAKVSEAGVNRIIVDASAKDAYVVGSNVIIITQKFASDDDKRQTCQDNTANRYKILGIEDVTIGTTEYAAIYVDAKTPFDTVAESTDSTVAPTIIFTVPWTSGSTDDVLGKTGSLNCTDGKHPIKLQGVEFANGQWEVLSDAINKLWKDTDGTYYYTCYTVNTASKQSTDITSDYIKGSSIQQPPGSDKWSYIKYNEYKNGMYFPTQVDGSSSTYTCDQVALNHDTDGQTREFLCFGDMGRGVAPSGLSCLRLYGDLGYRWWNLASRLSPNGNRGYWG